MLDQRMYACAVTVVCVCACVLVCVPVYVCVRALVVCTYPVPVLSRSEQSSDCK